MTRQFLNGARYSQHGAVNLRVVLEIVDVAFIRKLAPFECKHETDCSEFT